MTGDTERYGHLDIHVCESCKNVFETGDDLVSLSDGYADEDTAYEVNNRRFWHRNCFPAPVGEEPDRSSTGTEQIGDTEVIPREELEKTGENEHGPSYRCPRCGFEYVAEYCDCPDCLWAGMCQEGFE